MNHHDLPTSDYSYLRPALEASGPGVEDVTGSVSDRDYEVAWEEYTAARGTAARVCQNKLMNIIRENYPDVATIVLYEDRSHDAPHGHLEGIFNAHGSLLISGVSDAWHELEWASDADDLIWDIYHLGSQFFNNIGGKRRLILKVR